MDIFSVSTIMSVKVLTNDFRKTRNELYGIISHMNKPTNPLSDSYLDETKQGLIEKFVVPGTGVSTEAIEEAFESITQLKSATASAYEKIDKLYTQLEVIDNARQRVAEEAMPGGYMTKTERGLVQGAYDILTDRVQNEIDAPYIHLSSKDLNVTIKQTVKEFLLKFSKEDLEQRAVKAMTTKLERERREKVIPEFTDTEKAKYFELIQRYIHDKLHPKMTNGATVTKGGTRKSRRKSKRRR
jgi:hypothetical protein